MQPSLPCTRGYSMQRHITAAIIVCLIRGVTVLLLESLLPGFAIDGWRANIGVVLAFVIIPVPGSCYFVSPTRALEKSRLPARTSSMPS
jgi:hypothetical protein